MNRLIGLSIISLLLNCATAHALFMSPSPVPLDRIVINTMVRLEKNPGDAKLHYSLARAYYLAFFNQSHLVPAFEHKMSKGNERHYSIAPDWNASFQFIVIREEATRRALLGFEVESVEDLKPDQRQPFYLTLDNIRSSLIKDKWQPKKLNRDKAIAYAVKARSHFLKAIQGDAHPLYYLGLASLYEQVFAFQKSQKPIHPDFASLNLDLTREIYYKAFIMAKKEDADRKFFPVAGLPSLVSHEAGNAWIRLKGDDPRKIKIIQDHINQLKGLKPGPITPLIVTSEEMECPSDFVASGKYVQFDLDGDGIVEWREWISPEAGILVWDPTGSATVTSGRNLFGNYTFQLLWEDGFHALSILDNDGNRQIDGGELDGLSLWYDTNSNGISEAGEIKPVDHFNIRALKLNGIQQRDGMLIRPGGAVYEGEHTPVGHIWDWISQPGSPPLAR